MRYNSGAAKAPHLIISDEQIEGIVRFYAASATCQGDKLKWTPTCQGTNCGARMFAGFLLNLSLFLSSALGQLGVGPLRPLRGHSRLPARSSAERCPLGTSAPQRGRRDLAFCKLLVAHLLGSPSGGRYVPVGRCPAANRGGSREVGCGTASHDLDLTGAADEKMQRTGRTLRSR